MERGKILSTVGLIVIVSLAALVAGGLSDKSKNFDSGTAFSHTENDRAVKAGEAEAAGAGPTELTLSRQSQTASGISVERLGSLSYRHEIKAYGQVVDLDGLITLRNNFADAKAAARKAVLQLALSRNEYARAKTLFNSTKYVSLEELQNAEAAYYSDLADSESAFQNMSGIKAEISQQWGNRIADMVSKDAPLIREILGHEMSILILTVPARLDIGRAPDVAEVETVNRTLVRSYLVSISPVSNPNVQGVSYFYRVRTTPALPTGTNVVAYLRSDTKIEGVVIPASALVWLNGKAYVFVRRGEERFVRKEIAVTDPVRGGWFMNAGVIPGDEVVVAGAQLLLSQEFKGEAKGDGD